MGSQRLDKLLAAGGVYSRREAKALIRAGRVRVDGEAARAPEQQVPFGLEVLVDGRPVRNQPHLYIMMNKPAGVVCATEDTRERTVLDLLPQDLRRRGLFPAGRLDKDTEGFALLTDDGEFAHRILSPKMHVPKTYYAELSGGPLDEGALSRAMGEGLRLDGGDVCRPATLTVLENGTVPRVELVIREGMYHQVKRMFGVFSLRVTYLKRVKIGGLALDETLSPGKCREILHKECELMETGFRR